jgi:Protein of unknown function (DUF3106)
MAPYHKSSRAVTLTLILVTTSFRLTAAPVPTAERAPEALKAMLAPPLGSQSGIGYFRALLAARPEEREKLLASRSPEHRQVLESSVRRYEALSPEERETRLRTMELRFHVTSLLRVPPSKRDEQLKLVPENDRPAVAERLRYWDTLSPLEQKEALDNERAARILGVAGPGSKTREIPLTGQTSNQVRQIEQQLVRWQSLPEGRRQQVEKNFVALFEFSDEEKALGQLRALALSPEERELMEKTIEAFKKLPVTARANCVRNFPKFAELSPVERRDFLYNAQQWQRMSAADRDAWRKIVSKVPKFPPLPPGIRQPPLPRIAPSRIPVTALATNGGAVDPSTAR